MDNFILNAKTSEHITLGDENNSSVEKLVNFVNRRLGESLIQIVNDDNCKK